MIGLYQVTKHIPLKRGKDTGPPRSNPSSPIPLGIMKECFRTVIVYKTQKPVFKKDTVDNSMQYTPAIEFYCTNFSWSPLIIRRSHYNDIENIHCLILIKKINKLK